MDGQLLYRHFFGHHLQQGIYLARRTHTNGVAEGNFITTKLKQTKGKICYDRRGNITLVGQPATQEM
jgi:hypothetical protein